MSDEQQKPEPAVTGLDEQLDRRYRKRQWLAQVDFWEGVKEFILRRLPGSKRSVDQLY